MGGNNQSTPEPAAAPTPRTAAPAPKPVPIKEKYLKNPWRKVEFTKPEKADLLRVLQEYEMYDSAIPCYNFLLLGMVGHGKSSIVNTIATAVFDDGKVKHMTVAGAVTMGNTGSVTRIFRSHPFRKTKGGPEIAKFRYYDTMGVEDTGGLDETDLNEILDGCVKPGYTFSVHGIDKKSDHYNKKPTNADKMHAVAVCVDCTAIDMMQGEALRKMRAFKEKISTREIPFCILLTKIDLQLEADGADDMNRVFYNVSLKEAVDKCAALFGVPANQVFPIRNYHEETVPDLHVDMLMLKANMYLMDFADGFIRKFVDDA